MKAKVITNEAGKVTVKINRGYKLEILDVSYNESLTFKIGDVVEVKRVVNNPYLVVVKN